MLALWFLCLPCHAKGNKEARRLIQAARLDSLVVLAMPRAFYPRASPSDPDLLKASTCLATTRHSGFVEILAEAAQNTLSSEELRAASSFFDSPVGRKYADLTVWQGRADLGLTQVSPAPQFSRQEVDQVALFVKSPEGVKLAIPQLFIVPQVPLRTYQLSAQILRNCSDRAGK
jgi:hypothetical protein